MKKMVMITVLGLLSGCANYSEKFECGVGKGVGCKSLNHVNRLVESGQLPYDHDELPKPARSPDKMTTPIPLGFKIWVAGYRDDEGYFHAPSYSHLGASHD